MMGSRIPLAAPALALAAPLFLACEVDFRLDTRISQGIPEEKKNCWRADPENVIGYVPISGATWNGEGNLLIIESIVGEIREWGREGQDLGPVLAGLEGRLENYHPVGINERAGETIVESIGGRFIRLEEGEFSGVIDAWAAIRGEEGERWFIVWDWTRAGSELIVLARLGREGKPVDEHRSVVLRVPIDKPEAFELLAELDDEIVEEFWRTGQGHYSAAVGGRVAFLAMLERPRIFFERQSGVLEPLDSMPPMVSARPRLENIHWRSPGEFTELGAEVENAAMTVGLFGQGGKLLVLYRTPGHRGTDWWLAWIDPFRDIIEGIRRLPTRASHLAAVPGEEHWAFLEKGPIQGYGLQRVESILFIPQGELRAGGDQRWRALCGEEFR